MAAHPAAPVEGIEVRAATIPTDAPESDGTFAWDRTTLVLVVARAGGAAGVGFTYADLPAARLARDTLAACVTGRDALATGAAYDAMVQAVRNLGRPGIAAMAISAVDAALWDLAGRLLGAPLFRLAGAARTAIDAYGSGGFTSYSRAQLEAQLSGWAAQGFRMVKMKVGRDPAADPARVRQARAAIGPDVQLFVDFNGAHAPRQALAQAERFAADGVRWLEEPCPSDDLAGLRFVREHAPAGMDVAAGEYAWQPLDALRFLQAGALDVLQLDATRCGGPTGFLRAAAVCDAYGLPLSAHCAPQLHAHLCCAASRARHLEYFHDHARIERMVLDGALAPEDGRLRPDPSRPGLGVDVRWSDFAKHEVRV